MATQALLAQGTVPVTGMTDAISSVASQSMVTDVILCNQSNVAVTVQIALILQGESLTASNYLHYAFPLSALETKEWSTSVIMPIGSSLQMYTSSGAVVSYTISGLVGV